MSEEPAAANEADAGVEQAAASLVGVGEAAAAANEAGAGEEPAAASLAGVGEAQAAANEAGAGEEPAVVSAPVAPEIARELPGLGLAWCAFAVPGNPLARSPAALRARLRALSDRHRGAQAIALRGRAIPHAYRVLFRHLGLEPDVRRIPVEALMVERLRSGAYPSRAWLPDALVAATVETEVGVWALDADRVAGGLRLGLLGGRVAVADAAGPVAELFGAPGGHRVVTAATRRLLLYAVLAPGVPGIAVEEALWTAWDLLG